MPIPDGIKISDISIIPITYLYSMLFYMKKIRKFWGRSGLENYNIWGAARFFL